MESQDPQDDGSEGSESLEGSFCNNEMSSFQKLRESQLEVYSKLH